MITNDAVVLGLLMLVLALIFYTASLPGKVWKRFYTLVPPLLLCYFIPGLLNSFGIINGSTSQLYPVVSKYFLPACLVLFTIGMDWRSLGKLGPKALTAMLVGTAGIMLGGPLALWIVGLISPATVAGEGPDAVWRGLATIAGSWIGGGANQTALREVFKPSDRLFSQMVAVDVLIAELWMAFLIYGAGIAARVDTWLGADSRQIEEVKHHLDVQNKANEQNPAVRDYIFLAAAGFGATGLAHALSEIITPFLKENYPALEKYSLTSSFFWVITIATFIGIVLSVTPVRKLEYAGASKLGSVFLYVLIATIGMQMDLGAVAGNPGLFAIGLLWICIHAFILIIVCRWLKIPFFFLAVGSQANVGGSASASVVAAAFHPSLATVGVLLAILGYAIGTYGGYLTALMMQWISEG
ncbi:DUF819 family protein [Dyadobacter sediminis]|uniref:DUF819 family protein n=1 Tax=Dyadobacter sediminis TaxID=1493691 RepID=A0A5R9KFA3_9BACT|nr:DUF819 family protein [Dyadobacter sediminis]TLU94757.1 DUF819 family protein [Dyadobacter sediminis]GGB88420.1 membrane protein [Dyadobacter sediminis]